MRTLLKWAAVLNIFLVLSCAAAMAPHYSSIMKDTSKCMLLIDDRARSGDSGCCCLLISRCQFSEWTAQLNEIVQGQRKRLCPTDSRLRPDVRALEHGRYKQVGVTVSCGIYAMLFKQVTNSKGWPSGRGT